VTDRYVARIHWICENGRLDVPDTILRMFMLSATTYM
jgi:hypothetical protein